ncbi:hypothetical protein SBOR_1091 [Sclerotinia borealis F-4128]|uniref:Uncharacterized protein n=1 Tax=Sclerotinia borealis (strain F-4128) TaxID=1432307 RepID=W9CV09_SCLBF|nr:hypothetical protein SBOR_1091 [Sclerotinia borealis F-4128]
MTTSNPHPIPNRCQINIFKYQCQHKGQESGARCTLDGSNGHCIPQVVYTGNVKGEVCEECRNLPRNLIEGQSEGEREGHGGNDKGYQARCGVKKVYRYAGIGKNTRVLCRFGRSRQTRNNARRINIGRKIAESRGASGKHTKTQQIRFKHARSNASHWEKQDENEGIRQDGEGTIVIVEDEYR